MKHALITFLNILEKTVPSNFGLGIEMHCYVYIDRLKNIYRGNVFSAVL